MATEIESSANLTELTDAVVATYMTCGRIHHLDRSPLPSRDRVIDILDDLFEVIYPGYGRRQNLSHENIAYYVGSLLDGLRGKLTEQIGRALRHERCEDDAGLDADALAEQKALALMERLPELRLTLDRDVQAAFRGDPAATCTHEIIFAYPGLEAVTVYRIAHELLNLGVPFIPRLMTEYAHAKTGIDIHPGARIGPSFFIDHGTGVVVGETCEIGENVKLYQGVTLGALSFPKDEDGELIRGAKRHPTLSDEVVVYANATILGGETVIGRRAVIGSSVWITRSVPDETVVTLEKPSLRMRGSGADRDMYHI